MKLTRKRIMQALSLSTDEDKTKKAKRTPYKSRSKARSNTKDKKKKRSVNYENMDKGKKQKKGKRVIPPLCDTCLNVTNKAPAKFFAKTGEKWQNFPHHIPVLGRKVGGQNIDLDVGSKYGNRLVYYFAASPAKISDSSKPSNYPDGYLPMTNVGLMQLNSKGQAALYLDCPKVYKDSAHKGTKAEKRGVRQGYMNHVHILVGKKDMSGWEDIIFTQNVVCQISRAQFQYHIDEGNRMIINAIDAKFNLEGTDANIGYKEAGKMSVDMLCKTVLELAPKKIARGLDTPLVVYCYGPKCPAAKRLMDSLYASGFYNILYFPGGWLSAKGRH